MTNFQDAAEKAVDIALWERVSCEHSKYYPPSARYMGLPIMHDAHSAVAQFLAHQSAHDHFQAMASMMFDHTTLSPDFKSNLSGLSPAAAVERLFVEALEDRVGTLLEPVRLSREATFAGELGFRSYDVYTEVCSRLATGMVPGEIVSLMNHVGVTLPVLDRLTEYCAHAGHSQA